MVRTQIYLTKREHERLQRLAAHTGRSQSVLIRTAVDQFLEQQGAAGRQQVFEEVAGIWRERTDLPDFGALRHEAYRVAAANRPVQET